jgi:hypothetical protein
VSAAKMGIKYVKLLWIRVGDDWRARACRDCPPYILKEVCDDIYGADNWCIAWDLAYDRQALDDAKTNIATAIKGARMVFNPLVKKGCVARETRPRRPRSPRRITVVACLEGQNCGDYYDGRFPKRGYRAKGGKRRKVQFEHEEAVLKVLTRKGLEVSCEARVTLLSEADNSMRAGRPRGAAAS